MKEYLICYKNHDKEGNKCEGDFCITCERLNAEILLKARKDVMKDNDYMTLIVTNIICLDNL